jgi:predicted nucleic acid-binding protein
MNAVKAFFDTNILLYMYGGQDPGKRARATEVFRAHMADGSILVSTQVVQEFYAAGARKLGMPRRELTEAATALLELPLVVVGASEIRLAMHNEERYRISFWDSLILAAAEAGGAKVLFSEDLAHGQQYGRVEACNPFRSTPG